MIFTTAAGTGKSVAATAGSIFMLEIIRLFLRRMLLLEILIDPGFPANNTAAAVSQVCIYLVLRDKWLMLGQLCH